MIMQVIKLLNLVGDCYSIHYVLLFNSVQAFSLFLFSWLTDELFYEFGFSLA
jgi:hypothetical protein